VTHEERAYEPHTNNRKKCSSGSRVAPECPGKSESSLLCREYGWTLGVVDGEIPKTVLQELRK
jgi:hypothetical protein